MCETRGAFGRRARRVGARGAGRSRRAAAAAGGRETDATEAPARARARFERTVDDVERRFRAMRETWGMGWWGGEVGIAAHAREGIRAARERALASAATGRATRQPPEERSEEEPRKRRKLSSKNGQRMLRQWILDHFDAPFPDRAQKERLAERLGWSVACVSNFFINARQRFFKPLVLELARELEEEARERAGIAAPSVTASTETYSRKRARY